MASLPPALAAGKKAAVKLEFDTAGWKKATKKFVAENRKQYGTNYAACRVLMMRLIIKTLYKTPKDTGRAQGGWGAMPGITIPPGPGVAEGKALSSYKETTSGTKIEMALTNAVEYIEPLEHGHSKQAPFGMLRISERELEQEITGRAIPKEIEQAYAEAAARSGLTEEAVSGRAGGLARAFGLITEEDVESKA